ncbi:MAG: hypothetical protein NT042_08565 [Sulfuritalea sp.]|nr:hypothetical protein [Sulfuritalea sp.]
MNLDEFRHQMESYRRGADEEANALKDSYLALDRLQSLYRRFDAEERVMADQVLADWALSEDENVRFDALALIDDFKIKTAAPALQNLLTRLASLGTPGAPFELQKVNRILGDLSEKDPGSN